MRVRVSDPALSSDLVRFLEERADAIVAEVAEGELEVSLLGSLQEAHHRAEIEQRLQAWRGEQQGARAEIVDSQPRPVGA